MACMIGTIVRLPVFTRNRRQFINFCTHHVLMWCYPGSYDPDEWFFPGSESVDGTVAGAMKAGLAAYP